MGRHRKRRAANKICDIKGCDKEATRSLPIKKIEKYLDKAVKEGVTRRAHICKDHYKEYKKSSKTDRMTDRLAWRHGGIDPQ
jgi:hypothetical protein